MFEILQIIPAPLGAVYYSEDDPDYIEPIVCLALVRYDDGCVLIKAMRQDGTGVNDFDPVSDNEILEFRLEA